MARSLNRVQLIGNLTRDPELRYTPNGTAVCSFGLATNRAWKTETGEKKEEAEFHNLVAWNKLAEICSQFLVKGRKVFTEGRLATRSWVGKDGQPRSRTEIVISDMILLDNRRPEGDTVPQAPVSETKPEEDVTSSEKKDEKKESKKEKAEKKGEDVSKEEVVPDDIPF